MTIQTTASVYSSGLRKSEPLGHSKPEVALGNRCGCFTSPSTADSPNADLELSLESRFPGQVLDLQKIGFSNYDPIFIQEYQPLKSEHTFS